MIPGGQNLDLVGESRVNIGRHAGLLGRDNGKAQCHRAVN